MERKIVKVEEVTDKKREFFDKAKKVAKTVLKIAGGLIIALYGYLALTG